jgi:hypothetical protein
VTFGVEWRAFGLSLLLVLALQPIYLTALIATDTIAPADRRARVMAPSMQLLHNAEGDTITECVALAIGREPNTSALHNAIFAARPINGKDPCDGLRAAVEKQQDIQWLPYPRYWHGYRVVLDPLTAVFRIRDSQQVILIFLVAALAWFVIELQKIAGDRAALAFIFPTVLLTDLWRMFQIPPTRWPPHSFSQAAL